MREPGLAGTLQLGYNPVRQNFAQLYPPLVERVDVPDSALHKDLVLVQRDKFTQRFRGQAFRENAVSRMVAFTDTEWDLEGRRAFRCELLFHFPEGHRLR